MEKRRHNAASRTGSASCLARASVAGPRSRRAVGVCQYTWWRQQQQGALGESCRCGSQAAHGTQRSLVSSGSGTCAAVAHSATRCRSVLRCCERHDVRRLPRRQWLVLRASDRHRRHSRRHVSAILRTLRYWCGCFTRERSVLEKWTNFLQLLQYGDLQRRPCQLLGEWWADVRNVLLEQKYVHAALYQPARFQVLTISWPGVLQIRARRTTAALVGPA